MFLCPGQEHCTAPEMNYAIAVLGDAVVFVEGGRKTGVPGEKPSEHQDVNQQQTRLTYMHMYDLVQAGMKPGPH